MASPSIVLVLAAILGGVPSSDDVSASIGVNIHFTGAPAKDLDGIRDAGFGWVRMDFAWGSIEREKGAYRFEAYDALLDGLSARGLRALFILDYSNALWEKGRSVTTAEGRAAFARFAGAAAARYKGRGVRWEVWNEPNLEQFWSPQPAADDYAALAIEAAKAIRAADPEARILAPASSGFPWPFLERIFEKGLLEHIDEVSVHPYRSAPPETVRDDYARLRELIAKSLPEGKAVPPIVSGEWGYSTWHHGGTPFTAEVQAAYLARQLLTNLSEGIPLSIWYDWKNDGTDPKETEHNFGTVTHDLVPKPAYVAAKALTSVLGKARFERRLEAGADEHLLVFRNGDKRVLAAWSSGSPTSVPVRLGAAAAGSVPCTRMTGERTELPLSNGVLALALTSEPRYLELPGDGEEVSVCGVWVEPQANLLAVTVRASGAEIGGAVLTVRTFQPDGLGGETPMLESTRRLSLGRDAEVFHPVPVGFPPGVPVRVEAVVTSSPGGDVLARGGGRSGTSFVRLDVLGRRLSEHPPFAAVLDGDAKVPADAKVASVELGGGSSHPDRRALRLEYRFAAGWRFARLVPQAELPAPTGRLSVWVNGDGSGNTLRCRVRDAKGETFQPTYGPVIWKGWKRVEIPLDGSEAGSWGGDGKVDPPLAWDTLFLIDSTRDERSGTIEFAAPFLVVPGSP